MSYAQPGSRLTRSAGTSSPATTSTVTASSTTAEPLVDPASGIRIPPSGTLRLRAEAPTVSSQAQHNGSNNHQRRVQWAEDVVNNEGMGRKSSKVCCIYHKPKQVGESSDEDSSSSDESSSDSESDAPPNDDSSAPPSSGKERNSHGHSHHSHNCSNHSHSAKSQARDSKRRVNAYERVPKNR